MARRGAMEREQSRRGFGARLALRSRITGLAQHRLHYAESVGLAAPDGSGEWLTQLLAPIRVPAALAIWAFAVLPTVSHTLGAIGPDAVGGGLCSQEVNQARNPGPLSVGDRSAPAGIGHWGHCPFRGLGFDQALLPGANAHPVRSTTAAAHPPSRGISVSLPRSVWSSAQPRAPPALT